MLKSLFSLQKPKTIYKTNKIDAFDIPEIMFPICNNKTIMNTCFSTMLIFLKMLYDYSSTAYVVVYAVR